MYSGYTYLISIALAALLTSCSFNVQDVVPDRRPDYRRSQIVDPLEVPPDLTASTIDDTLLVPDLNPSESASLSDYAVERGSDGRPVVSESILRDRPDMRIERDGSQRWLVVQASADTLWPRIKEFWTSNGLPLSRDDPRIGVMETDWLENRADIADGPVRAVLKRFLDFAYSAPTRDKFRVRLEPNGQNTDIYLTHYGVEEVIDGASVNTLQRASTNTRWQSRPGDSELEAEMLNRLMVYLGASERRAQAELAKGIAPPQTPRAAITTSPDGQRVLVIEDNYDRSWRLVGLALDGGDFAIEDQNRSQGLYVVEYIDEIKDSQRKGGVLSKLAFWRSEAPKRPEGERYQVRLAGREGRTLVLVQNAEGRPDDSEIARRILDNIRQSISRT